MLILPKYFKKDENVKRRIYKVCSLLFCWYQPSQLGSHSLRVAVVVRTQRTYLGVVRAATQGVYRLINSHSPRINHIKRKIEAPKGEHALQKPAALHRRRF